MKYSEADLIIPALEIIRDNPGINTSNLIDILTKKLILSDEDTKIYKGRNDTVFSQTVRNLCGSHLYSNEFGKCVEIKKIKSRNHFWINQKGIAKIR